MTTSKVITLFKDARWPHSQEEGTIQIVIHTNYGPRETLLGKYSNWEGKAVLRG